MSRHVLLALFAAGCALFVIGLLLWRVFGIDETAIAAAARLLPGAWDVGLIARFTNLGGAVTMVPVALAGCGWLWSRGEARAAAWLFATVAGGRLAIEGVKIACHRARPPATDRFVAVDSWSFPSSHCAGTMLTLVALALASRAGWRGLAPAIAAALAIGWTRMALGVHWPGDVSAGWGLGLAWAAGAALVSPPGRRAPAPSRRPPRA